MNRVQPSYSSAITLIAGGGLLFSLGIAGMALDSAGFALVMLALAGVLMFTGLDRTRSVTKNR